MKDYQEISTDVVIFSKVPINVILLTFFAIVTVYHEMEQIIIQLYCIY